MSNEDKNISIDAIAEMWAKLAIAQIQAKTQQKTDTPTDQNKKKHE